jgi:hypothetical protein
MTDDNNETIGVADLPPDDIDETVRVIGSKIAQAVDAAVGDQKLSYAMTMAGVAHFVAIMLGERGDETATHWCRMMLAERGLIAKGMELAHPSQEGFKPGAFDTGAIVEALGLGEESGTQSRVEKVAKRVEKALLAEFSGQGVPTVDISAGLALFCGALLAIEPDERMMSWIEIMRLIRKRTKRDLEARRAASGAAVPEAP